MTTKFTEPKTGYFQRLLLSLSIPAYR